jgi:hypothetical protein
MNVRKTILLAAVLGALVWYIQSVELPEDGAKLAAQQPFRGVPLEQFAALTVTREGQTFRFVNDAVQKDAAESAPTPDALALASVDRSKTWRLADVPAGALDKGALNALLNAVSTLSLEKAIPRGELDPDRGVYGLASPSIEVVVSRGADSKKIQLGDLNPYVSKRYVGWGDDVYLMTDGLFNAANKPRDDFRKRTPIDFVDSELRGLLLTSPAGELAFSLSDSFQWRMVKPAEYTASDAALAELGRSLRNIRVEEFIDTPGPDSDYGFGAASVVVTLDFRPEVRATPIVAEFSVREGAAGGKAADAFLRLRGMGTVMRLASDPRSLFIKSVFEFREKALFKFATEKVEDITIEPAEGEKVVLKRAGTEWQVNGAPGDSPFINDYVKLLAGLEVNAFVTPGTAEGLEKPALTITVSTRGDKPGAPAVKRVLVVSARSVDEPHRKGYYAAVDDQKEPFLIDPEKLKNLQPRREVLVKVTSSAAAADQVSAAEAADSLAGVAEELSALEPGGTDAEEIDSVAVEAVSGAGESAASSTP